MNEMHIDANKIPTSFWNFGQEIKVAVQPDLFRKTGSEWLVDYDQGTINMQDLSSMNGGPAPIMQMQMFYKSLSRILLNPVDRHKDIPFVDLFGRCLHQLFFTAQYGMMDPIIPEHFLIFGMAYDVYFDPLLLQDAQRLGLCFLENGSIRIAYGPGNDVWNSRKVFFHEWCHLAFDSLGQGDAGEDETAMDTIAKQILQFVRTANYDGK